MTKLELDKIKALALYPLPHHWVSRVIFFATRLSLPFNKSIIRWFIRQFDVDLADSKESNLDNFATFNEFFTRELKPGARPLPPGTTSLISPADGKVSQFGDIHAGAILQAKQHSYSVQDLLACDRESANRYNNGSFATVYLSPRDYHRVHMPADGKLVRMTHVPGRLFSVAPYTVNHVPSLFARNERVIAEFDSAFGKLALVLVGAINVAAIETVWAGLITPPAGRKISTQSYIDEPLELDRGAEMGRFNMGSTVIVLTEKTLNWHAQIQPGVAIKMGSELALPT